MLYGKWLQPEEDLTDAFQLRREIFIFVYKDFSFNLKGINEIPNTKSKAFNRFTVISTITFRRKNLFKVCGKCIVAYIWRWKKQTI